MNREQLVSIVLNRYRVDLAAVADQIPVGMRDQMEQSSVGMSEIAIDALIEAGAVTLDAGDVELADAQHQLATAVLENRKSRVALNTNYRIDVDARSIRVDAILETLLDAVLPLGTADRVQFELGVAATIGNKIASMAEAAETQRVAAAEERTALVAASAGALLTPQG